MQAVNQALLILFVGMFTVFVILALVVWTGWGLIHLTNRLTQKPAKSRRVIIPPPSDRISAKKLAAIAAAVELATDGRGKIEKIERE